MENTKRVIIIGAGFGGLFAARTFAGKPIEVLLVDRNNYHTFTPLLYQVATSALDPSQIAYPIRSIFRSAENIHCLMGEVTEIDTQNKIVVIEMEDGQRRENYDYLIIATGSVPTYFGNEAFKKHAFELNTLEDAIVLRNHILRLFEQAAWTENDQLRAALTTLVVVGGGPTGLETAGALYELYNHVLDREFGPDKRLQARVVLVELLPHLLAVYPTKLRQAALEQLNSLGVEVLLGNPVTVLADNHIQLADGQVIPTHTVIWTAGVKASPAADFLGIELRDNGQILVNNTMEVEGYEGIYAVGDIAYLEDQFGIPYPMLIPVAKQQGILVAKNIYRQTRGLEPQTFNYHDRGIMATIGRRRAVAWIFNRIQLRGFIAWLAWLGLHLLTLLGFRNQLNVLVNWVWNYFTYDRSVRIILD
ncbi:MAG: NAD(P)/FAD-dependent oxidoreductase [Anaerolineales bacterium]